MRKLFAYIFFSKKVLTTNIEVKYTLSKDIMVIIIGLVAYLIIVYYHQFIAYVYLWHR